MTESKKKANAETTMPVDKALQEDNEKKAEATLMHDGITQLAVDEKGDQYVRQADTEVLRPENMATQAQIQHAFSPTALNAKPEDGKLSTSVDGMGTKLVFPMKALTHLVVGVNSYGPGQPFDAGSNENRESLIAQKAAVDRQLKISEDMRPDDPSRNMQATNLTI